MLLRSTVMKRVFASAVFAAFASAAMADTFLDGTYVVGQGVEAGFYTAPGGDHCTWYVLHTVDDNTTGSGRDPVVEISAGDVLFHSQECGLWKDAPAPRSHQATMRWPGSANGPLHLAWVLLPCW